jgi:hypothetical protein
MIQVFLFIYSGGQFNGTVGSLAFFLFHVLDGGVIWGQNSRENIRRKKEECDQDTVYPSVISSAGFRMEKRR